MLGDIGDLSPDHETLLVAEIVEILIVLIVSETDGGSSHLHNEVDILCVMLGEKGVTHAKTVLMAGYTAEGIFLAVEDKSVVGIDLEASAAETVANVIKNGLALNDLDLTAIEIGILASVPEVNVFNIENNLLVGGLDLLKLVFFLVVNGVNQFLTFAELGGVYLNGNVCISGVIARPGPP